MFNFFSPLVLGCFIWNRFSVVANPDVGGGGNHHRTIVSYQLPNYDHPAENVPSLPGMNADYLKFVGLLCRPTCNVNRSSELFSYDGEGFLSTFIDQTVSTMFTVSKKRKFATAALMKSVLMQCIPGDVVETGVFTGGSTAVIMKVLLSLDKCNRKFYVFDSFAGLPPAVAKDKIGPNHVGIAGAFSSSYDVFKNNLKSVDVWDDKILIVEKGWFSETIPVSAVQHISFLRLDGDVYESTKDAMIGLYPKLVRGGYIYVDDYGSFNGCKIAVDEYRTAHRIYETMHFIYDEGNVVEAVWWQKA